MIKPCDKGAGIILLDFDKYVEAGENHLNSKQVDKYGNFHPYYAEVNESEIEEAKI